MGECHGQSDNSKERGRGPGGGGGGRKRQRENTSEFAIADQVPSLEDVGIAAVVAICSGRTGPQGFCSDGGDLKGYLYYAQAPGRNGEIGTPMGHVTGLHFVVEIAIDERAMPAMSGPEDECIHSSDVALCSGG